MYTAAMTHADVIAALEALRNAKKAAFLPSFFKTGPGQYGEGDVFWGVTVPQIRSVAKRFGNLPLAEAERLLPNPVHEVRLAGVLLLVTRYQKGDTKTREETVRFYLSHLPCVNNWDLVDTSAPYILGDWLLTRDRSLLDTFARSGELWTQRVAIVATYAFIRKGELEDTFRIAEILLHHPHDLIHKAVGWMLREAGKKNRLALEAFVEKHAADMPRTMLRYALEKFGQDERKRYMGMKKARKSSTLTA
jgi:3-methyladenine DNA glycosylase AlkD